MDAQQILALKVEELKQLLRTEGLEATGRKIELQHRLLVHYGLTEDGNDEEEEEEDVTVHGPEQVVDQFKCLFTLKDVRESMSSYSGSDTSDINQWLEEFEDQAVTLRWNDLQKFIYAKQLLQGAARMFLKSAKKVKDWQSLKKALINEFGQKLSSARIHQILRNRKHRSNESLKVRVARH